MKICPKCGSNHTKPGTFCSRKCANSRVFSAESRKKKSLANKTYWWNLSDEKKKEIINKTLGVAMSRQEKFLLELFERDFDHLSRQSKRVRVILEQEGVCLQCGLNEWRGELLPLELDHIDGNNKDDRRDNLRILCPNCHSITPTWKGRNTNSGRNGRTYIKQIVERHKNQNRS